MLEKVGITIAFLIPITVLIINCLTIAEKIQNLMKNKKSKRKSVHASVSDQRDNANVYADKPLKGIKFPFSYYPYYNMDKHIVNMKRFSLWFTNITFIVLFLLFLFIKDYFSSGTQSLITGIFIVTCIIIILLWIAYFVYAKRR